MYKQIRKNITTKITLAFFAMSLIFCNGCVYLAKQGSGLVRERSRAVSIDKLLRDDELDNQKREFLTQVQDIINFAIDSIGLKQNRNYTKFVQTKRDYIVDVVVASKDDSFDLHKWWFPITGSVSYKGFFNRKDAEREAARVARRGYNDVHIGRANAYSTLGILSDPIYSFMVDYSIYDLASLIIHEQTHATIWIKGETQLNEEIATFVGDVGGLLYVRNRFGEESDEYREAILSKEDYRTYIDLLRNLHGELSVIYESDLSRPRKLNEKERIFEEFRNHVANNYDELFKTPRYTGLKELRANNALVASRMTYNLDMELFYELYEYLDKDLSALVRELEKLKKVKRDHKDHLRAKLIARSNNDPSK